MANYRWFFLVGAAFLTLADSGWSQRAPNWRALKPADGLPELACASVSVSAGGNILLGHLNVPAFSRLDGYTNQIIRSPVVDHGGLYESPGGQLWTVTAGRLAEWRNGNWVLHPVPEITGLITNSGISRFPPLCPVRQGRVLVLLPDRLMEFNAEDPDAPETSILRRSEQTRIGTFAGMCAARDGGLWVCGARGLAKLPGPARSIQVQTEWREYSVPGSLSIQNLREPREDRTGGITAVADSTTSEQIVIVNFDGEHWTTQPAGSHKITRAWRGPDRKLWAVTTDLLLKWDEDRTEFVEDEDVPARQYHEVAHKYHDVAIAADGTFWLATSDGLLHYTMSAWTTPEPVRNATSLARCLTETPDGRLWFVLGNQLHVLDGDRHQSWPFPSATQNPQAIRNLMPLPRGNLLVLAGNQLLQFQPGDGFFKPPLEKADGALLNCVGQLKDNLVCFQRFGSGDAKRDYRLEIYDGAEFRPFPHPNPNLTGNLSSLFTARNGDLWIGGDQGVALLHDGKWQEFTSEDHTTPEHAIAFAETADGKIWCAARERIWEFDGRNWLEVKGGFEPINSMLRSRDGSIWVASGSGLARFFQSFWIENNTEEGLPDSTILDLFEDQRGRIWAGTAHGLSCFDPEADTDPPLVAIQNPTETDQPTRQGETVNISFRGIDRWKYTSRNRLLYTWRLDEHNWSAAAEAVPVSYTGLPVGKHSFQVRALDRHGNITADAAELAFVVVAPWYKEKRLVTISIAGLIVAMFFAALAFNRHRQLLNSYSEVERKIAERTRELEIANRELLHSQKMNALGTLSAGIAHDFNNILSIIKGSTQIIEDNLENPPKIQTRLDRIKTVVEQGSGIVNAMLGFSRGSEQSSAPCDLNAVISDTVKLLGDRFLREVEISFQPATTLPEIPVAKDFVQQILLNFIFNAAESMDHRKQIILATRLMDTPPKDVVLLPAAADSYIFVEVQDHGAGISPENLPRIFEPFFTTKALSTRRGTGLGLSMVYELAKKLDAGLAVQSIVNHGSTFTLILPVLPVAEEAKTTTPQSP